MKKNKQLIALGMLAFLIIACQESKENSQGENFLNEVDKVAVEIQNDSAVLGFFKDPRTPLPVAFTSLPQGSTKPRAWMEELMKQDLQEGIVGALDELYPGIKKDDLFRTARRGGLEDVPEMGDLVLTGEAWEQSIMWWNAETIGNWWDGFVRHAYLTQDEEAIAQAKAIVENLLASQDDDGYLGIYKPNLRYQHKGSNGELWAQTTAFRTLLGYYELTQDTEALQAVERGMAVTMERYNQGEKHPFELENAFGGVTHGLMMTDVCETLYRISGKQAYQDYATFLYQNFSTYNINRAFNDLRYPYLTEKDSLFTGHAVHTYEHFRSLVNAYYHTGYPALKTAFENALYKLEKASLPSGAGHGNEWLAGMEADPNHTHSEYCTMLELRNSLSSMFQKTGDIQYADRAEKLTYNGMMGARDPGGKAITYGKGDNCYILDSQHHGEEGNRKDVRYKNSPVHSDPAVCCVPNYARNLPYFLDQMWLRAKDGLVAAMYGPSLLHTSVNEVPISIEQDTDYPFSDQISFTLTLDAPTTFALYFRKPTWAKQLKLRVEGASQKEEQGFIKIEKTWESGDQIRLSFEHEILEQTFANKEVYLQRGPLLYAYSIPHRVEVIKKYPETDFTDFHCYPLASDHQNLQLPSLDSWVYEPPNGSDLRNPWYENQPRLSAQGISLIPMGSTVLRQLTFPKATGL